MIEQPRIRGAAYQKKDKTWGWEAIITLGDMPVDHPGALVVNNETTSYLSKEAAIDGLKKASIEISKEIAKAQGVKWCPEKDGLYDLTKGFKKESGSSFLEKDKFGIKYF